MTQLSDHLTLEEFIHSDTAIANNIDNTLPDNLMQNAIDVATNVFEPVRELLGVPIKLDSGYRNAEVNVLVRGVPTSQHTEGKAIDMVPEGISIADAFAKAMNEFANQNCEYYCEIKLAPEPINKLEC